MQYFVTWNKVKADTNGNVRAIGIVYVSSTYDSTLPDGRKIYRSESVPKLEIVGGYEDVLEVCSALQGSGKASVAWLTGHYPLLRSMPRKASFVPRVGAGEVLRDWQALSEKRRGPRGVIQPHQLLAKYG